RVYSSMGYKRPPSLRPAATTTLLNRDFVVDPAQVDALPIPHDASHDVDDDRDDVGRQEVVDGVRGRLERRAVQVVLVERPLVQHEQQEQPSDHANALDVMDDGHL